ncbi:MAG: hypothetical protein KDK91_03005 [Gammaproteobacteria bacterium]|nr:hypothetical protein [Gammaproteobacteria bacterium]
MTISFAQRECNWLQALEGDIDTSHFGFLHVGHIDPDELGTDDPIRHTVADRAPEYQVTDTPRGTSYGASRPNGPSQTYWRFANFLLPFWTQQPQSEFSHPVHARAWVPMDDTHTMYICVICKHTRRAMFARRADGTPIAGLEPINRSCAQPTRGVMPATHRRGGPTPSCC